MSFLPEKQLMVMTVVLLSMVAISMMLVRMASDRDHADDHDGGVDGLMVMVVMMSMVMLRLWL